MLVEETDIEKATVVSVKAVFTLSVLKGLTHGIYTMADMFMLLMPQPSGDVIEPHPHV